MSNNINTTSGNSTTQERKVIILAGATGNLGKRIADFLVKKNTIVKAIVRRESTSKEIVSLREKGVSIFESDFNNISELSRACSGGNCIISALSGLREVIVDLQFKLVKAAVEAGVPRFIPSDFSIDFTQLSAGTNRNLDFRREFSERLEKEPVSATSILNGMFMELLPVEAHIILKGIKRIMYWGDADQPMDFTTINDTARFTAEAALDTTTPRYLKIAGEVTSIRGLKKIVTEVYENKFGLMRLGGLGVLKNMIKLTRLMSPNNNELYPPWQGMQYLHNMLSGKPKLEPLDNERYPEIKWTSIRDILSKYILKECKK